MNFEVKENKILINIPAKNGGKFRFKKRKSNLDFGNIFATQKIDFDENSYLEWQIGYDALISEVKKGNKVTKLVTESFIGSNKKEKYLYELSEFLFDAIKIGIIQKDKVVNLLEEIKNYSEFIDDKNIDIEHNKKISINNISFDEVSIKLPTLFMVETLDGTQIEISKKQQQYASGVQPMVYFCIPLKSFGNFNKFIGKCSNKGDYLIYEINKNNSQVLFDLIKIFAMCSKRHNYDVIEILNLILR